MDSDPDTDRVLAALSRIGADHNPDVAALRRHIDRRQPSPATARRNTRSVLLSAAAVLLVGGGVALVASVGGTAQKPAGSPQPTSPTVSTTNTAARPTPPSSGPTSSRGAGTGKPSPAARPKRSGRSVLVDVQAVSAASTANVQLDASVLLDWLAVGARSDVTVVRAKKAAAAPVLAFDQPSGVTAVPGPFRVSWTGGTPEQSHTAATTWLRMTGPAGLSVSVAPSPRPRTVMLAAGTADLAATVRVSGGSVLAPTSLGHASGTPRAVVITLRLPATTATSVIRVTGTATGERPLVFLSVVTVAAG